MATLDQQNTPEEGRPPDDTPDTVSRKQLNRKLSIPPISTKNHNINNKYSYLGNDVVHDYHSLVPDDLEEFDNNNVPLEDNVKLVQDVNRNISEPATKVPNNRVEKSSLKHTLPKLLCLKKSLILNDDKIERNCLKTLNVNSLETLNSNSISGSSTKFCTNTKSASRILTNLNNSSCDKNNTLAATTSSKVCERTLDYDNYYSEKPRNRNNFHQNVEEALNSLLWQPYEYQNTNGRSDSVSTGSCTPCSSCSVDLDEPLDTTKNTSSLLRCNYTPNATEDLHSNVINLTEEVPFHQSAFFFCPRDGRSESSTGALGLLASFSSNLKARAPEQTLLSDCVCDVNKIICGDIMQSVNVNSQPSASNTVLDLNAGENGLNAFQQTFDSSLNSANIVGLPSNHTRYASVPSSTFQNESSRSQSAIFPQHVRNISEPSNQFVRYPVQQNNTSFIPQGSIVPTHHRQSSQVEQHNNNLQLINHFRSSSVPKSMSIAPKQDFTAISANRGTTATQSNNNARVIQQKIPNSSTTNKVNQTVASSTKSQKDLTAAQQQSNISNVNVNFYRAVPVNVVSSVPTIHCLNTLSNDQGNSVSNVQVLPLESNYQLQQTQLQTPVNNNTPFANSITTHVTVHNTNNSIQVPTNPSQINRSSLGSSVFSPQVSGSVQTRYSNIVNASTITNFLPPPPPQSTIFNNNTVNVQNNKQVLTTGIPISQTNNRSVSTSVQNSNVTVPGNNTQHNLQGDIHTPVTKTRTFTSTEAQTDDIVAVPPQSNEQNVSNREQRRRDRRERRHNRRISTSGHRHTNDTGTQAGNSIQNNDRLPDILNSHLPPPYSTLPNSQPPQSILSSVGPPPPTLMSPPHVVPPQIMPNAIIPPHGPMLQTVLPNAVPASAFVFPSPQQVVQGQVPLMQGAQPVPVAVPAPPSGFRFPFPANGFRRARFSEDPPKGCCGILAWKPGSLRWFIALIALVAVCCVLVGTALGAMRPAGRDHLTVSLLMIGVGIVLVTVSGVAWRLTSHDSSTCRSMLGMGSTESVDVCTRRFVPRLPPSYGRPHHPYAAMMYPEFQYRPPPPSYQASMQEYRLRLLLLDRGNTPQIQAGIQNAVSPPPTYRSHAGSLLRGPLSSRRDATQSEYSCPPSYRSQNSSNRQSALHNGSVFHSREQSLSISDSNPGEVVNVVSILGSAEEDIALDNITLDSLKMEPETDITQLKMFIKGSHSDLEGSKDGNLVTIVQTSDQSPVIVTVSGSSQDNSSSVQITEIPSEMEILAHL